MSLHVCRISKRTWDWHHRLLSVAYFVSAEVSKSNHLRRRAQDEEIFSTSQEIQTYELELFVWDFCDIQICTIKIDATNPFCKHRADRPCGEWKLFRFHACGLVKKSQTLCAHRFQKTSVMFQYIFTCLLKKFRQTVYCESSASRWLLPALLLSLTDSGSSFDLRWPRSMHLMIHDRPMWTERISAGNYAGCDKGYGACQSCLTVAEIRDARIQYSSFSKLTDTQLTNALCQAHLQDDPSFYHMTGVLWLRKHRQLTPATLAQYKKWVQQSLIQKQAKLLELLDFSSPLITKVQNQGESMFSNNLYVTDK